MFQVVRIRYPLGIVTAAAFLLSACMQVQGQDVSAGNTPPTDAAQAAAAPSETAPSETAAPAQAPPPAGPGMQEFERTFSRWKTQLKELRDLQHRFVIAEESETDGIRDQFLAKVEETRATLAPLRAAALKAYAEAPDERPQLTALLLKLAEDDVERDRFESALEIGQVMVELNTAAKPIYDIAGMAAYALHEFERAERYWKRAAELGEFERGEKYVSLIPELITNWQAEQEIRAKEAEADDLPRVLLSTTQGDIVLELFENEAPQTVGNFIYLVEKGFYKDIVFHRVLKNFMAQTGDPRGDGTGGPGYNIYCECYREDHRNHFRGSVSMAKSAARDSGGSQFFMTFVPTPHLNGLHTVFGRVVEGMEVLEKLQRRDPDDSTSRAVTPDRILDAKVLRKRDHTYEPTKVQ